MNKQLTDAELIAEVRAIATVQVRVDGRLIEGRVDLPAAKVARLCDLAERQNDVRAAVRTLIQRAETAEREMAIATERMDNSIAECHVQLQRTITAEVALADAEYRADTAQGHVERLAGELRGAEGVISDLREQLAEARGDCDGLMADYQGFGEQHIRLLDERDEAQALASELAAALSEAREFVDKYAKMVATDGYMARASYAVDCRGNIDALLATDAAQGALERRKRERAVIEAARELEGAADIWLAEQALHDALDELDALAAEQQEGQNADR